jgi:hypothetical protein
MTAGSYRYWTWHIDGTRAHKLLFFIFHNHVFLFFCALEFPLGLVLCLVTRCAVLLMALLACGVVNHFPSAFRACFLALLEAR